MAIFASRTQADNIVNNLHLHRFEMGLSFQKLMWGAASFNPTASMSTTVDRATAIPGGGGGGGNSTGPGAAFQAESQVRKTRLWPPTTPYLGFLCRSSSFACEVFLPRGKTGALGFPLPFQTSLVSGDGLSGSVVFHRNETWYIRSHGVVCRASALASRP